MTLSQSSSKRWFVYNWQSPKKGHDRFLVVDGLAGVADGATPLDPSWPQNVGEFAEQILSETSIHLDNSSLAEALRTAINNVRRILDIHEPFLSTSIALCSFTESTLDYLSLGDCSIVYKCKSQDPVHLVDTALERLDEVAYAIKDQIQRLDVLKKHRSLMNSGHSDGYWTVSANPDAVQHAVTGALSLSELEWILVCTDGFTRWAEGQFESLINAAIHLSKSPNSEFSLSQQNSISSELDTEADDATGLLWINS